MIKIGSRVKSIDPRRENAGKLIGSVVAIRQDSFGVLDQPRTVVDIKFDYTLAIAKNIWVYFVEEIENDTCNL